MIMAAENPETRGFSATAMRLVALLEPHTPFAVAIVKRQCERCGLSPEQLTPPDAAKVSPLIAAAAGTFVDPSALASIKQALGLRK